MHEGADLLLSEEVRHSYLCSEEEIEGFVVVNAVEGVAHDADVAFDVE